MDRFYALFNREAITDALNKIRQEKRALHPTFITNGEHHYHDDNGQLHREGGPAFICPERGISKYYKHGTLHREDGPAIIDLKRGTQKYYQNGKQHREDGPATIYSSGLEEYKINGQLHREGGPAVIRPDGTREWWRFNRLHNEEGPALILPDGTREYYLNDLLFSKYMWEMKMAEAKLEEPK